MKQKQAILSFRTKAINETKLSGTTHTNYYSSTINRQFPLSVLFLILSFNFLISVSSAQTWQQADSLRQLHMEKQSFDTALIYAQQAADLVKEEFGEMDTLYADMLYNIGDVYYNNGEYEKSIEFGLKEKDIRLQVHGKLHLKYITIICDLGLCYNNIGEYDKSLLFYLEALENCENYLGKHHSKYGNILSKLAFLYHDMGQFDKALSSYLDALEITEESLGKEHSQYGLRLNNLAVLYNDMGQYSKALPILLEVLVNTEKTLGKEHPYYGARLNNLAVLYIDMGQYDKALPLLIDAQNICEVTLGKAHLEYGTSLNNLAYLYDDMGQYDKALLLYIEALECYQKSIGKNNLIYKSLLNNMASLFQRMGQFSKALEFYSEALAILVETLGRENSYYGSLICNMAGLYEDMGQNDKALVLFSEALKNCEQYIGKGNSIYGVHLNNLALLYKSMGQYDKALPLAIEAFENTEKSLGKEHSYYGNRLNNLASLYYTMSQNEKALPLYREAIQNNFYNINKAFSFLAESEKEKFIKTLSENFNNYKSFFLDYATENPAVAGDAYNIELATKGMILQSGIQMREAIQQSGDSAALAKYDQWQVLRLTIANQYSQPIENRLQNLPEMEAEAEALEGELARVSSAFAESQSLGAIEWTDVQQVLNPNEACVEFSSFAYKKAGETTDSIMYVALVLLPDSEHPILVPLCEQKQLDSILVQSLSNKSSLNRMYRAAILPDFNSVDYGKRLYELIWQPLEKYIPENTLVYFAPSGSLHKIAFAAIPIDDNTRLSDNYRLMQLSSTAVLLQESKFNNTPGSITLFGGINYEADTEELLATAENIRSRQDFVSRSISTEADRGSSTWGYLPGTLQEVNAIENISIQNNIKTLKFTGSEAIEEQFKSLKGNNSPRIIHISTHGFFFEDAEQGEHYNAAKNPLNRAGLLFAGANTTWQGKTTNDGIDDGILTAFEATNVTFGNTQLIVLSACETGLGEIRGSEGVFGLQRAFKNAGAEYIMMSLWKVPDAETAEFMEYFYTKLFGGETIPEAFRNTQNYMKLKYPEEPYNWAAFVLVR